MRGFSHEVPAPAHEIDEPDWRGFIDVDGLAVAAARWIGDTVGPPERSVLLLHGLGASTIHWELVGAQLSRRLDADVTAIDLAGFGFTRAPASAATVEANAALATRVLELIGPSTVFANSMGAAVALPVAAARPELVRRLVLVTPVLPQPAPPEPAYPILPHNWPAALPVLGPLLVAAYAAQHSDSRVVDDRLRRSFFDPRRVHPEIRERMIALVRARRSFAEGPAAYANATRSLFAYVTDPERMARHVEDVRCPVLIVHGAHDRLVPVELASAALRRRPDWDLRVLEECGHLPQLEWPERFVSITS